MDLRPYDLKLHDSAGLEQIVGRVAIDAIHPIDGFMMRRQKIRLGRAWAYLVCPVVIEWNQ
jgi:hypothetical protein